MDSNKNSYNKKSFNQKIKNNNKKQLPKKTKMPLASAKNKLIRNKKNQYKSNKKSIIPKTLKKEDFAYWDKTYLDLQLECCITKKEIKDVLLAFANPDDENKPIAFESALESVKQSEAMNLQEGQEISYIGNNKFAVIENKNNNIKIIKTIEYKKENDFNSQWQEKIKFQLNRDIPKSFNLKELYSNEEIQAFPKLGSELLSYFIKSGDINEFR